MNGKQIGLSVLLVDFLGLNAYVVYQYGYLGFFEMMLANAATVAIAVDLIIALSLILSWMWRGTPGARHFTAPLRAADVGAGQCRAVGLFIRREASESVRPLQVPAAAA